MRALIAEDEQTARKLMQAYLRNIATCDVAANGREAVHKFRLALENRQPYDLICMDIGMPDMNGRESMKVIRQIEAEHGIEMGQGAKIIMTTAFNDKETILESFQEGCESYLVKPIRLEAFKSELRDLGLIKT